MSKKILLADDSVTIQKVIELTFMDEDYEIVSVSNGDDALGQLDADASDLVIADVHMPGASGFEVCRRSKQLRPEVPVVLLVGTFEPFDDAEAREAGADRYLKKPFDSTELQQVVDELLGGTAAEEPAAPEAAAAAPPPAAETPAVEPADEPLDGPTWAQPGPGLVEDQPFRLPADEQPRLAAEDDVFDLAAAEEEEPAVRSAGYRWDEGPQAAAAGDADEDLLVVDESPFDDFDDLEEPAEESAGEPAASMPAAAGAADVMDLDDTAAERPAAFAAAPHRVSAEEAIDRAAEQAPSPPAVEEPAAAAADGPLSDGDVDRIARRVAELVGDRVMREIAWEVVPDLAEVVIKDRLRELEGQID